MKRLACLALVALLLAGCESAPTTQPPTTTGTTQPPAPSTLTLYLLFPQCRQGQNDALHGTTTYNTSDIPFRYSCGWQAQELVPEKPCGFFTVHDLNLTVHRGDRLAGAVQIAAGPGVMPTKRLTWRDAEGVFAEATEQVPLPTTSEVQVTLSTMATRDSTGAIRFEVYVDGGNCRTTAVGDDGSGDFSRFTIERA